MVHISTQDLVECCTTCGYGCDGGYPGAAWNYYKESGIVSGGEFNAPKNERVRLSVIFKYIFFLVSFEKNLLAPMKLISSIRRISHSVLTDFEMD